jgi:hypothetical protein
VYARVATFEGGDEERLQKLTEERLSSGTMNTPEGMKHVIMLADREKNRRLFIALFDSPEAITAAEQRFEEMGDEIPDDIRGRRLSVDVYEVLSDEDV